MPASPINMLKRCLGVLFMILLLTTSSEAVTQKNSPKLLLFSTIDIQYLADTMKIWGESTGINGFFLAYVAEWWTPKDELFKNLSVLKEINENGKIYGIDSNFVKVALSYGNERVGALPDWTDDRAWSKIVENFSNIATLIKESGTKGIAIDTEYYNVSLFNPKSERFKTVDSELLKRKVQQRGREIMQAMITVYPDIEIILLQEGAYWVDRKEKEYVLWPDFYNGLASVHNAKGIILGTESTYDIFDKNSLKERFTQVNNSMEKYAQDVSFWRKNGSIAIGMWPLGKENDNKSARYSSTQFKEQLQTAVSLSPRYIWIYSHGAAWWQMTPSELKKYSTKRWIWGNEYQTLSMDPSIQQYFAITKNR